VVASLRRREVRRAGRHRSAELTHGSSQLFPRRLARADVCPQRANAQHPMMPRMRSFPRLRPVCASSHAPDSVVFLLAVRAGACAY
jgi:hypothetical protein